MIETRFYNSLIPVFADREPQGRELEDFTVCKNQPYSFQMAFKITDKSAASMDFYIRIKSELDISLYYVNYVPVIHTSCVSPVQPTGLYPDILLPKSTNPKLVDAPSPWDRNTTEDGEDNLLCAYNDSWQSVWFCVNERSKQSKTGMQDIEIEIYNRRRELISKSLIKANVLPLNLPKRPPNTSWFHCDCIASTYNVEIFSDRFFEIMENYVDKFTMNGLNMILTPAITPALDTPIGGERMTAQLVKIVKNGSDYEFDFSLLKRFIDICRKKGVEYFEHPHLFTQWGSESAPKIVATVNGKEKQIFGWKTKSMGRSYITFLRKYLTSLKEFIYSEKLEKRFMFHISDEPVYENLDRYCEVADKIYDLLKDFTILEALEDYRVYEKGYIDIPVCKTITAHTFEGRCDNLWVYYTGEESTGDKSNRIFQVPRERNRMLGVQMYANNVKGFLQWAYNYYYGKQSRYLFNPAYNPSGGFHLAGTSYLVYPAINGDAYQSVRQKMYADGINDVRLMRLLEKQTSREMCERIMNKYFGKVTFDTSPDNPETFIDFIDEVYAELEKSVDKK